MSFFRTWTAPSKNGKKLLNFKSFAVFGVAWPAKRGPLFCENYALGIMVVEHEKWKEELLLERGHLLENYAPLMHLEQ